MLKGMKDQFRVCVATVGDGAAADPNLYDYMYGSIIIWLGEWVCYFVTVTFLLGTKVALTCHACRLPITCLVKPAL